MRAGCPTIADSEADSDATPTFRVVEKLVSIVLTYQKWSSSMLFIALECEAYDQVITLLVYSGESQNFLNLAAMKKSPMIYEALSRDGKREERTVRFANGTLVKFEKVHVELDFGSVTSHVKEFHNARHEECVWLHTRHAMV